MYFFPRGVHISREISTGGVPISQEISTGGVLFFGEYLFSVTPENANDRKAHQRQSRHFRAEYWYRLRWSINKHNKWEYSFHSGKHCMIDYQWLTRGLLEAGAPCRVPTWAKRTKNHANITSLSSLKG